MASVLTRFGRPPQAGLFNRKQELGHWTRRTIKLHNDNLNKYLADMFNISHKKTVVKQSF